MPKASPNSTVKLSSIGQRGSDTLGEVKAEGDPNVAHLESVHIFIQAPLKDLLTDLKDLRSHGLYIFVTNSDGISWFSRSSEEEDQF